MEELLAKHDAFHGAECKGQDVQRIREILRDNRNQGSPRDVAFRMGDIYRKVVQVCLDGDFGAADGPDLLESFNRRVITELGRCVI